VRIDGKDRHRTVEFVTFAVAAIEDLGADETHRDRATSVNVGLLSATLNEFSERLVYHASGLGVKCR
jgi:hypothetical protein